MLQGRIAFRKTEAAIAVVSPALLVVGALPFIPAREKAGRSFFRVAKIFAQNAGRIGEVHHVITEEKIVLDNVPDNAAEKRDVAAGAHRSPDIGQRAGARKSWIDVNDGGAALFCFHDPAKPDRVSFGHGRAFDQNAIGVSEILLRSRSSAPAKAGAQTGHRAAMSYPRLVGYADHPQAKSEQFSDEIIFFVIERCAAEMANRSRVIDGRAVFFVHKRPLARLPDAVRHHVHRAIEWNFRPLFGARRAIFHFRLAAVVREQLIRSRAFRAKIPLTDRTLRISFNGDELAVLVINELPATNSAIRANTERHLRVVGSRID